MHIRTFTVAGWLLLAATPAFAADRCAVCGNPLGSGVYFMQDAVTKEKKELCDACARLTTVCYICGMPVKAGYKELADGRIVCARDAKDVVLDAAEAKRICRETKDDLDRLLLRFLTFPDTNVTIAMVDRLNLVELFKFPGNDYECPNALGYVRTTTNGSALHHDISLLTGLPRGALRATCAHEFTHTWLNENLTEARKEALRSEAAEGFCELVAFLLMDAQHDAFQKSVIRSNLYTRGQIELFIDAEKRYGFNSIVEWMKYGQDGSLERGDLGRVQNVNLPDHAPARSLPPVYPTAVAPPDILILRGITWNERRPMALINDQTFEAKETGKVRLGRTNVTIRCLSIRRDAVTIQRVDSGEELELRLKAK